MTPSAIEQAVTAILDREGRTYTNDPTDPGGPTHYGITLQTLRGWRRNSALTAGDVQALSEQEARTIYVARYIHAPGFHRISNDRVAAFLVDTGVLHGPVVTIRLFQEVLGVRVDGVIGPQTLQASSQTPSEGVLAALGWKRMDREVRKALDSARKRFGASEFNKTKLKYIRGWLRRTWEHVGGP